MTRIFRKLRTDLVHEGNARNYLAHALGEILLLIVGIVIGLQVNNWNEERVEHAGAPGKGDSGAGGEYRGDHRAAAQ